MWRICDCPDQGDWAPDYCTDCKKEYCPDCGAGCACDEFATASNNDRDPEDWFYDDEETKD